MTAYQLTTPDENIKTWSFDDPAYDKFITEGILPDETVGWLVRHNHPNEGWYMSESDVAAVATQITEDEYNEYFKRIGSHPPQKP